MLDLLSDPQAWLTFLTLTLLEIVLGIDNVLFISVLVGRLPQARQRAARITGLSLAMLTRIALLFTIVWLTRLTRPLFHIGALGVSGRDLILFAGGAFLLVKSGDEIRRTLAGAAEPRRASVHASFLLVVVEIALIDIVFSLDSVFTAVGLARDLPIMVAAIVIAIIVMMWVSGGLSAFIERYPTLKVLALAFLLLVGGVLVAEALHVEVSKSYLYFAIAFSLGVELINIRLRALLDARRRRGA